MRSARCSRTGRNTASVAGRRPRADCAPAEWAHRPVWMARGSRFQASAVSLRPAARPSRRSIARVELCASWPIVVTPASASLARVAGPTPHISSTGRSCRKATSPAGSTTTRPSGLATCEAIFARCLVRATPIEIGSPSSPRTRARTRSAMSAGAPNSRAEAETSANASSMEMRSTSGVKSASTAIAASPSR